ncbi:unnamed protein product [Amoebophrya sp. A25]|nr:unnamed protein product [Amoebophrya sp. A25]|eukprot:GSA25T00003123001.1
MSSSAEAASLDASRGVSLGGGMVVHTNSKGDMVYEACPPKVHPPRGRYEWNQVRGGGILVTFSDVPRDAILHWKMEWLRAGHKHGCKFSGYTTHTDGENRKEEFTSNFRIQPHRMGFMRRKHGEGSMLELNYPGKYLLQAWLCDANEIVISRVTSVVYEVVNVGLLKSDGSSSRGGKKE